MQLQAQSIHTTRRVRSEGHGSEPASKVAATLLKQATHRHHSAHHSSQDAANCCNAEHTRQRTRTGVGFTHAGTTVEGVRVGIPQELVGGMHTTPISFASVAQHHVPQWP